MGNETEYRTKRTENNVISEQVLLYHTYWQYQEKIVRQIRFFTKKKKWHAGRVRGKTFTGGNGAAKAYLDDFFAAGFFAGAFFAGDCFAAGFFAGAFFGAERFRASSWSQGDGAADSGSGSAGRDAQAQEP